MKPVLATILFCLLLSMILFFSPGCGKAKKPPADPGVARDALRAALDAWKNGDHIGSLKVHAPPIQITDREWGGGYQLLDYKVLEEDQLFGSDLRCQVQLSLRNPKGKSLQKRATYSVGTNNALTVVREDDD
jgi:hypothetical protein